MTGGIGSECIIHRSGHPDGKGKATKNGGMVCGGKFAL